MFILARCLKLAAEVESLVLNSGVMSENTVNITVKLFAAYQEAYGVSELKLLLDQGTKVKDVCDRLIAEHPELQQWRKVTRFGVNLQFVEPDTVLQNEDEIVLIPPVSGG